MTGTSDDEEGKWKNRSTTLRRLGRQYSPDVTPEVASRRLKQWIVGNPVGSEMCIRDRSRPARTLARERLDGFAAGADAKAGGTDCAGPWGTLKTEYET